MDRADYTKTRRCRPSSINLWCEATVAVAAKSCMGDKEKNRKKKRKKERVGA